MTTLLIVIIALLVAAVAAMAIYYNRLYGKYTALERKRDARCLEYKA